MSSFEYDWRYQGEHFEQRAILMSSFIRNRIPLSIDVYEFCDFQISQGYTVPEDNYELDKDMYVFFERWKNEVKYC